MAINSAIIRIRRGPKDDLRIDKLLPGELAMATDAPVMWFCWAPGNIEQVPTSENITEIVAEIIKEYLKDNPVTGISEIYMRVADGFIQYSSDNETWNNLLALYDITGTDGNDGYSPSVNISKDGKVTTITITDKNGEHTVTINDGADGKDGKDGKTAYQYAQDGGYTGTEEQFSQKLAKEYPSKTSELENDSEFITKAVSDLANYYLKSETYSKSEINQRLSAIPKFAIQVVASLPLSGDSTTVYLLKSGDEESNLYTEYIYVNGRWEFLGSQSIAAGIPTKLSELTNDTGYITKAVTDLANYYNKIASDNKYQPKGNYLTEHQDLSGYAKKATTLSGYGITDGATKEEFNQLSKEKVDYDDIVQEAGESERLVMSQKAVTQLVNDALGTNNTEYETVDSVEEMTDTTKQYVLKSTGTVWTYGEVTVEKEPENKFVPSTATLNSRLSGSGGSVSASDGAKGSFVTDFIAIKDLSSASFYNVRANWEIPVTDENKVVFYNSGKSRIGNTVIYDSISRADGESVIDIKKMYNIGSVEPTWADVAYVRFQLFVKEKGTAITSADIADKTITFDAEGGTVTEIDWYDTGMKPDSTSSNGNYVDLLVKVNKNKTDIYEVSERVTALETGSETLTIPTFWQSAVDECIAKIKALQVGRNCITFPFFSDNHQRNGYVGILIAYIMKECNIPYCIYGGDSISSGTIVDEAEMIEQDKAFDTIMSYVPNGRLCRAVGNHDGYWYDGTNKYYYTREQIYELFLREESIAQNKHFGDDGTYYYVDDIASKTRFIVMNTNGGSVDSAQLTWLQNTALKFNENGWAVVFISHQPISNHYHALISNAEEVRTVVKNYISGSATNKADVVGWFSGHIHRDRIYTGIAVNTSDDSVGTSMGFTQVTITSDATSIAYDDATKHTGTSDNKSHAIDFVTINKNTRTVNLTRLGIGSDRSYTY